jgi:hypothetical protein
MSTTWESLFAQAEHILRTEGPDALAAWEAHLSAQDKARLEDEWRSFTAAVKGMAEAHRKYAAQMRDAADRMGRAIG